MGAKLYFAFPLQGGAKPGVQNPYYVGGFFAALPPVLHPLIL